MDNIALIQGLMGIAGVPLILALVQAMKGFITSSRWYLPIAIIFGLAINLLAAWALGGMTKIELVAGIFSGVMAGLSAGGLYSYTQIGKQDVPVTTPPSTSETDTGSITLTGGGGGG